MPGAAEGVWEQLGGGNVPSRAWWCHQGLRTRRVPMAEVSPALGAPSSCALSLPRSWWGYPVPKEGTGKSWGRQTCQKSPERASCELCRELSCCGSPWSNPDVNPPSALYLSTLRLLTALLWGPALLWDWILPFAERRTQWVLTLVPEQRFFFHISKWWLIE